RHGDPRAGPVPRVLRDARSLLRGGRRYGQRIHVDPLVRLVGDDALDQGEDRIVLRLLGVAARRELGAELAEDDPARLHLRAAVHLDPAVLRVAVAPVADAALTLLVRHGS